MHMCLCVCTCGHVLPHVGLHCVTVCVPVMGVVGGIPRAVHPELSWAKEEGEEGTGNKCPG